MAELSYRAKIDSLIAERNGEVCLNGSDTQAAITIERMFKHAQQSVQILTKTFDPRIYGDSEVVRQASLFLGLTDRKAEILVEEPEGLNFREHPFLRKLGMRPNLLLRTVHADISHEVKVNFAIMDDRGFRLVQDRSSAVGIVVFGDPFVSKVKGLFQDLWELGEVVSVPQAA